MKESQNVKLKIEKERDAQKKQLQNLREIRLKFVGEQSEEKNVRDKIFCSRNVRQRRKKFRRKKTIRYIKFFKYNNRN